MLPIIDKFDISRLKFDMKASLLAYSL